MRQRVQGTVWGGLALVALAAGDAGTIAREAGGFASAAPPPSVTGDHSFCGTERDGVRRALLEHAAWTTAGVTALPTTSSYDTLGIAVLEDDGTILRPFNAQVRLDPIAATRAFYRTHGDDYDFLLFYAASSLPYVVIPNTSAFAYEIDVVQDVAGIGKAFWDFTKDFGSGGRLQSICNLNSLAAYPADPYANVVVTNNTLDILAHEAGHRWLAYVQNDSAGMTTDSFLGSGLQHWNFYYDSDAGMLGGNDWADNGDGTWTSVEATARYGPLELYLMGYLPADSVGAQTVLYDATLCTPPGNYTKQHHALDGVTCDVRPESFTIGDIITANGARVPDAASSPKTHRFAFVLVIGNGTTPSGADLAKLGTIRAEWPGYFAAATGNRGTADTTLISRNPNVVVLHDGLPDSEDAAGPYTVEAAISLEAGSVRAAVTAATLEYGVNGGGLVPLAMSESSPGVYEADIPGQALGSEVRYRVHVETDAGVHGWWPDSASTHTFDVATDLEPPVVTIVSAITEIAPGYSEGPEWKYGVVPSRLFVMAEDNIGISELWMRYGVLAPSDSILCTRIGASDSFYVDLPDWYGYFEYSLRAVDASAAGNESVAASCAGECVGVVGESWFEMLDASDGGFVPGAVTGGARNQWHWTDQDDATGRAAWKCGDAGALNYLAGLDAGLVTPPIPLTAPSILRFRHRYDSELESPGVAYDGGLVEISVSGGPWESLTPTGGYPAQLADDGFLPASTPVFGGRSAGWDVGDFVEAEFLIFSPTNWLDSATVRFRFRFVSDGFVGGGGWFVDDIVFEPAGPAGVGPVVTSHSGLQVQPNPARGQVRFVAPLEGAAQLTLDVFDAAGRRVARPFAGAASGEFRHTWDAGRSPGGALPPGVYWARLTGNRNGTPLPARIQRFVLLR